MSVFEFDDAGQTAEQSASGEPSAERGGATIAKTVTVMESSDGSGGTRFRSYLPAEIARELEVSGGDTLLMEYREESDTIEVSAP